MFGEFIYTCSNLWFICSGSTPISSPLPYYKKMLSQIKQCRCHCFLSWVDISIVDIVTCYVCLIYSGACSVFKVLNGRLISSFIVFSLRLLCRQVAYMVYDILTVYVMLLCLYLLLIFDILLLFVMLLYYGAREKLRRDRRRKKYYSSYSYPMFYTCLYLYQWFTSIRLYESFMRVYL
jgi:hypothetical protein